MVIASPRARGKATSFIKSQSKVFQTPFLIPSCVPTEWDSHGIFQHFLFFLSASVTDLFVPRICRAAETSNVTKNIFILYMYILEMYLFYRSIYLSQPIKPLLKKKKKKKNLCSFTTLGRNKLSDNIYVFHKAELFSQQLHF